MAKISKKDIDKYIENVNFFKTEINIKMIAIKKNENKDNLKVMSLNKEIEDLEVKFKKYKIDNLNIEDKIQQQKIVKEQKSEIEKNKQKQKQKEELEKSIPIELKEKQNELFNLEKEFNKLQIDINTNEKSIYFIQENIDEKENIIKNLKEKLLIEEKIYNEEVAKINIIKDNLDKELILNKELIINIDLLHDEIIDINLNIERQKQKELDLLLASEKTQKAQEDLEEALKRLEDAKIAFSNAEKDLSKLK